jgi:DNA helicase-2/ATP-dependent DNA helicase PcrA
VKNVLVLVPNGLFVGALKNVLPSLGERETSLRTFDQWIIEMLGAPIEYERQDQSLETLLDSSIAVSEKVMRHRNAQNKGSLKMAVVLERYVAILYQGVLEGKTTLVCATSQRAKNAFKVERTPDDLRRVLDEVRHLPFNQRRDAAERRLVKDISHELVTAVLGSSYDENGQPYRLIESHVQRLVHQYFTGWNSLNAVAVYRRLLSSPDLLRRAGDEIFDDGDLELMTCEAPGGSMPFRFGDLAALLYLKILLDGKCDVHYDHIVIDGAHDITPMFFEVLSEHSQASMTLLSDLAQGLYFHHGVKVWDELAHAMDEPSWRLETIRESYRSTQEIADYANAMLRRLGVARDELAQPISRSGPAPALHHFRNRSTLIAQLPGILRGEQDSGHGSIAVVCKTLTACRALAAELAKAGFTDHRLIADRDVEYMGGTVILPSYLTNGLEFDAVVLADADANTYAPDELNAWLLYVAITRAAHSLHVCWVGAITLFLDEDHSSIVVQPMLGGSVVPGPVTIEAYVNRNPRYSADECVQSLAAADKLWLLKKGVVDEMLLEIEMRAAARAPQTSGRGVADLPIDRLARADLQEQVAQLSSSTDEDVKSALAFLQLAYGLLRDWMPGAGAARSDDGELHDQVIQMATLMRTLRANGLTPGIPPQTTRSRALQAVAASRRETAERLLSALIDLGIVEELDGPARAWLRVPADRVQGMLELSLGHTPNEWEPDWVAQLPRLSAPLGNVLDQAR